MSQSAVHRYPEGPSQGTLTTPSHYSDHKRSYTSTSFTSLTSLTSTSPSPVFASCATTPTAAMAVSPVTVYSDRLYQVPLAPTADVSPRRPAPMPVEFIRAHAKGCVRFPPFETGLDAAAVRAIVDDFQIYPFGDIAEYCRHIPYASGKKDFYEKTGRESFEVFQYVFRVADNGKEKEYHVMWDYNVGLVRMTPFFKCCKYSKTTPAKMLGLNPGLREITHSITGGSIMAQGYWMPYECARAVCATFCYRIAGALVPIFGPEFPAACVPPQSPDFGRMVIDKALVQAATRDTERMRQMTLKDAKAASKPPFQMQMQMPMQMQLQQTRHQSLELDMNLDYRYEHERYNQYEYERYEQYEQYEQYQYEYGPYDYREKMLPQRHRDGDDMDRSYHGAHAQYAHAHAQSSGYPERGPELAPLRHFTSHRGSLLPSPIEHEKLPPFSHILSLSDRRRPESQRERQTGTTLPPLIVREGYPHVQPDTNMEVEVDADRDSHGYDDYSRAAHVGPVEAQANTARHAQSRTEHDSERQTRWPEDRFVQSCYPSPPRVFSPQKDREKEIQKDRGHRKSVSMSSVPRPRRRHRFVERRRALKSETWNAKDADAAQLLVHLRDDGQDELDNEEYDYEYDDYARVQESIPVRTSPQQLALPLLPAPQTQMQTQTQTQTQTQPERFAACISSLLCDDSTPRKKRRGV